MGFLELRQEPALYSRVTAEMAIRNSTLFSKVRTPVYLGRIPQESKLGLAGNTDASGGEVGDKASVSSFHRDIGIPFNIQEVSGLGTF